MQPEQIYLNTAGSGIVLPAGIKASQSFTQELGNNPSRVFLEWMEKELPLLRRHTTQLFHAREDEIAFLPNFSFALSAVLQGLKGKVQNVLLYDADYPSLNLPFEVNGFRLHYIKDEDGFHLNEEQLFEKIKKYKIELLALSHVQFLTGYKIDLQKITTFCRDQGVLFIVDGTQSMGAVPIDFGKLPADVLIGSCYKWLNGGFGSAILCVKKEFIEKYPPGVAGFGSIDHSDPDWAYHPSFKSFEPGHLSAAPLLQLEEGIKQKLEDGLESIDRHNSSLIKQLHDGLRALPYPIIGEGDLEHRLHILIFEAAKEVGEALQQRNISVTWRRNTIRVSPHFHNTKEEIEGLLNALEEIAQTKR